MIVVHSKSDIHRISNVAIGTMVQQRIDALHGDGFDLADLGYFLVVEAGDTIETIDAQVGFPILCNRITGIRWDQPGFTASFEFVEEFPACFDLVFVISDEGFGVELFVPTADGVNPDLLAICHQYSVPGAT